ncbi:DUF2802 domain-containing protein [Paraglaciecola sp. L3A3]|uniref:DUF2802 domain-containing protein n=1 Tax=Paraglaciecola sp. L3A3 TaxID=2686358 RepID=UPI001E539781|nr:DUF2802 domain-containing protein [Paraglaciecola sp. L3A3]
MIISLVALGISLLLAIFLVKVVLANRSQASNIESQASQLISCKQQINSFINELHEVRTGNYGLVNRLKELELQVKELQQTQQTFVEQDPQSRFYNKGVKLISQGASIEEVVQECEIPLAEAELLFNLHHNQN